VTQDCAADRACDAIVDADGDRFGDGLGDCDDGNPDVNPWAQRSATRTASTTTATARSTRWPTRTRDAQGAASTRTATVSGRRSTTRATSSTAAGATGLHHRRRLPGGRCLPGRPVHLLRRTGGAAAGRRLLLRRRLQGHLVGPEPLRRLRDPLRHARAVRPQAMLGGRGRCTCPSEPDEAGATRWSIRPAARVWAARTPTATRPTAAPAAAIARRRSVAGHVATSVR